MSQNIGDGQTLIPVLVATGTAGGIALLAFLPAEALVPLGVALAGLAGSAAAIGFTILKGK